jgi:hypothetical protein
MPERLSAKDEAKFPNLATSGYSKTSEKDVRYNCVAWAADWDRSRWWEPFGGTGKYWPQGVPEGYYVENYMRAFATLGYEPCESPAVEPGFEKIALFRGELDLFSHVAKQLPNGKWTSKLGAGNDIIHESIDAFEQSRYGVAHRFMKRPLRRMPLPANLGAAGANSI